MKKDLIQSKIIDPIMRLKPKHISKKDFLALVFHTDSRIISTYFVKEKFKIPGLYLEHDSIPTKQAGAKHRQVKRLDYLIARTDDREPNFITVDYKGHIFLLNRYEWKRILRYLQLRKGNQVL